MTIRLAGAMTGLCLAAAMAVVACSEGGGPVAPSNQPVAPTAVADLPPSASTARYRVDFQASWSASTHPTDFPRNAHFSRLVGGTHTAAVQFWAEGALASPGIRDMAERGRTTPLDDEVRTAVAAGTAGQVLVGGDIPASPGSVSLEFDITQRHPLVTLVSMIAPSPDWFVGVAGLPLFENGAWVPQRRVDLVPWDAGTDSGASYSSADEVTSPARPITRILASPVAPNGRVTPLGTFTFTRVQ